MPYLNCFVDDRTLAILERQSIVRNLSVEALAGRAIESSAISTLPGGLHHPAGFDGDRWSADRFDLGGTSVGLQPRENGSMSVVPDYPRTTFTNGGIIAGEFHGDPDDFRFTVIP